MPMKCLNCDSVNPDGASTCYSCGHATLYCVQDRGKPKPTGLSGILHSKVPAKFEASFFLLALCIFIVYELMDTQSHYARCTATGSGRIDAKYTKVDHSKLFIPLYTNYQVKYAFTVNNREYVGQDTLSNEPKSRQAQIRYNPSNPAENFIEAQDLAGSALLAVIFGSLGIFALFVKSEKG